MADQKTIAAVTVAAVVCAATLAAAQSSQTAPPPPRTKADAHRQIADFIKTTTTRLADLRETTSVELEYAENWIQRSVRNTADMAKRVEKVGGRVDLLPAVGISPCEEMQTQLNRVRAGMVDFEARINLIQVDAQRGTARSASCASKEDVDAIRAIAARIQANYSAIRSDDRLGEGLRELRKLADERSEAHAVGLGDFDSERQTLQEYVARASAAETTYTSARLEAGESYEGLRKAFDPPREFNVNPELAAAMTALMKEDAAWVLTRRPSSKSFTSEIESLRKEMNRVDDQRRRIQDGVKANYACENPPIPSNTDILVLMAKMTGASRSATGLEAAADVCEATLRPAPPAILGNSSSKVDQTTVENQGKGLGLGEKPAPPLVIAPATDPPPPSKPAADPPKPAPPPRNPPTPAWEGTYELKGMPSVTLKLATTTSAVFVAAGRKAPPECASAKAYFTGDLTWQPGGYWKDRYFFEESATGGTQVVACSLENGTLRGSFYEAEGWVRQKRGVFYLSMNSSGEVGGDWHEVNNTFRAGWNGRKTR